MKILWLSRHFMTEDQTADLKRIFTDFEVIQCDKTIEDVKDIISDDIDVYAVVLPTDKLIELYNEIKGKARLIVPMSGRKKTNNKSINPATGKEETEYVFAHIGWKEYKRLECEAVIL